MANTQEHATHRGLVPPKLPLPLNPELARHAEARAANLQNRISDAITRFAGSMAFVYFHIIWFAVWIICGIEGYPYGLLTMIVSLEAIFLSTFVMISQNRADFKRHRGRSAVEDGPGRGPAEQATDRAEQSDPRTDQGRARDDVHRRRAADHTRL